jgi:hypothetical protein
MLGLPQQGKIKDIMHRYSGMLVRYRATLTNITTEERLKESTIEANHKYHRSTRKFTYMETQEPGKAGQQEKHVGPEHASRLRTNGLMSFARKPRDWSGTIYET